MNKKIKSPSSNTYKIQVGSFNDKKNAEAMVSKLKTLGFDPFIVGSSEAASKTKTIDEVAKEVVQGLWGNGSERKSAIEKAGYDYAEVQKRVNALL